MRVPLIGFHLQNHTFAYDLHMWICPHAMDTSAHVKMNVLPNVLPCVPLGYATANPAFCFCTGGLSCHWALWYDNLVERIWDFQPAIMFDYLKVICYQKSWWTYDCPLGDSWSSYGISGSGPISRDGRPIGKHSRKGARWMTFERKAWTLLSVLHVLQTNRCIMFLTRCRYTILVCT